MHEEEISEAFAHKQTTVNVGHQGSCRHFHDHDPCYRSPSALQARIVPGTRACPRECPETGVFEGVSHECLQGLWTPGSGVSKKCPESVPECPTLFFRFWGYSRDTFRTLRSPGQDTPGGHSPFQDTLGDSPATLQGLRLGQVKKGAQIFKGESAGH